ncbi:MAG: hypothetical protein V3T88_03780 [Nitrosomonadaceae bacterium]
MFGRVREGDCIPNGIYVDFEWNIVFITASIGKMSYCLRLRYRTKFKEFCWNFTKWVTADDDNLKAAQDKRIQERFNKPE